MIKRSFRLDEQIFFTSGLMPSHDIFLIFEEDLVVEKSWEINGTHYAKTLQSMASKSL